MEGLDKRRQYFSKAEVAIHNVETDCWVSAFNRVYDVTRLVAAHKGLLTKPLIQNAGKDVSHWFDSRSYEVLTHIDQKSGLRVPYTPEGRFVHVSPGAVPTTSWNSDFEKEWWKDDNYIIGRLTMKSRNVRIINTLTGQKNTIQVCLEETLGDIQNRYLPFNAHASSYSWKYLGKPLDMLKTLAENGVQDDTAEFTRLSIQEDFYLPAIHLYFKDDLTVA
uniref:Cytochrome b5 domain-containing protein 1 n=1 Tax=Hirondellea gigas TaxID=1518452 RepID=A0A6A7GE06_9CRUS